MDDQQLIEAYYEGDDEAFNQLYVRYTNQLIGRLNSKHRFGFQEAETIAEEAMVKVALTKNSERARYNPNKGATFRTWLYTIVKNVTHSSFSRGQKLQHFLEGKKPATKTGKEEVADQKEERIEPLPPPRTNVNDLGGKVVEGRLRPVDSPDDEAIANELLQVIETCQNGLPENQQQVLDLHRKGKSNKEISEEIGEYYGTVGRLLHDARQEMQKCLKSKGSQVA